MPGRLLPRNREAAEPSDSALHAKVGHVERRALKAGEHPVIALGMVAGAVGDTSHDSQLVGNLRLAGQ
jgi:hypothetical protein